MDLTADIGYTYTFAFPDFSPFTASRQSAYGQRFTDTGKKWITAEAAFDYKFRKNKRHSKVHLQRASKKIEPLLPIDSISGVTLPT